MIMKANDGISVKHYLSMWYEGTEKAISDNDGILVEHYLSMWYDELKR